MPPLLTPNTNENSKKTTGKTAETAPSACVEISRPIQMLANVCDADCSALLSIIGINFPVGVFPDVQLGGTAAQVTGYGPPSSIT